MKQLLKDQRKEQIMSAALNVISAKGYEQSRMDDIVSESDLSKGAIYWYYKSKKEIYLSLVDHWVSEYSSGMFEALEEIESASEKLKKLFHFFSDQFKNNPVTFKVLVEFWRMASLDNSFNKKLQHVYQDFQDYLMEIIDLGIKKGEFKKIDPRITALSILINIEGIHWFTLFDKSGVQAHEYIDTITDFILNGLKKKV
tara:strand:- start:4192 stop:4788 length:597 start_codon:yes stop_codon:yes gene_type:complete